MNHNKAIDKLISIIISLLEENTVYNSFIVHFFIVGIIIIFISLLFNYGIQLDWRYKTRINFFFHTTNSTNYLQLYFSSSSLLSSSPFLSLSCIIFYTRIT